MIDLYEELNELIRALNDARASYALCGGLAMAVHGRVRATIDIDLLIPADESERAQAICGSRGFTIRAHPMTMAGGQVPIERFSKIEESAGDVLSVDLLIVTDATRRVWETRQQVQWEGTALSVVSREGLIQLKSLRRSGQDLDDIAWLEEKGD